MSHTIEAGEIVAVTLSYGTVPAIAESSGDIGDELQARLMADPSTVVILPTTATPGTVGTMAKVPDRVTFEDRVEAADQRALNSLVPSPAGTDPDNALWDSAIYGLGVSTRFGSRRFVLSLPMNLDHFGRPPVGVSLRVRSVGGIPEAVFTATMRRLPANAASLEMWTFNGDPAPPPAAITGAQVANTLTLNFPVGVNSVAASNFPCRAFVEVLTGTINLPPSTPYQIISYWPEYQ